MITPKEFKRRMVKAYEENNRDPEDFHIAADRLMMEVLEEHGYADGVLFFGQKEKWYA